MCERSERGGMGSAYPKRPQYQSPTISDYQDHLTNMSLADLMARMKKTASGPPPGLKRGQMLVGSSVLEKLTNLFTTRSDSSSHPVVTEEDDDRILGCQRGQTGKGIAFCLVIVDRLHHEELWRKWSETDQGEYSAHFYIHAKNPEKITSEWVKDRLLKHETGESRDGKNDTEDSTGKQFVTYRPEWNSPEVIRAMLSCMVAALKEISNARFIFGTESCIPIYSLSKFGELLFKEDKSWLKVKSQDTTATQGASGRFEMDHCFGPVRESKIIPPKAVWKSFPGWICLIRSHAFEISLLSAGCLLKERDTHPLLKATKVLGSHGEHTDLVRAFGTTGAYKYLEGQVWAPEEMYFATMLALLGYLKLGQPDQVKRQSINYALLEKVGDANPINYDYFNERLLKEFRKDGALLARKMTNGSVDYARWKGVVSQLDKNGASSSVEERGDVEGTQPKAKKPRL